MVVFKKIAADNIRKYISDSLHNQKPVLSNFFVAEKRACYLTFNTDKTVFVLKQEVGFYRLFIVTIDKKDAIENLNDFANDTYVLNIPTKGDISEWDEFMLEAGFKKIGHYKRLFNTKVKARKSAIDTFATIKDLNDIEVLLSNNFSKYVDYLPNRTELYDMINNGQVIADYNREGKICGVLIYTLEGKKCYLNAWIDVGTNGLFLLYKAYSIAAENGIGFVYFWVNSENTSVLRLHEMMGAKYDGLNDYTYTKIKK